MMVSLRKLFRLTFAAMQLELAAHAAPITITSAIESEKFEIQSKANVDLEGLDPRMHIVLKTVTEAYRDLAIPVKPVVTSGAEIYDWREQWSLHHKGFAIDLRGKNLPIKSLEQICTVLQKRLDPNFDIVLENHGEFDPLTHIHIEYDPKVQQSTSAVTGV